MDRFCAYYRVSRGKQEASGLGLEAQQAAVAAYVEGKGELVDSRTEIESGAAKKRRPMLQEALAICKARKATLVVARLDRLSRSVAFISALMESKVDFIACDMPHANKVTIHVLAAIAEYERELISTRTKEAMAAAKKNGATFGNPNLEQARKRATEVRWPLLLKPEVRELILKNHARGIGCTTIAKQLNVLGITTAHGAKWYGSSVYAVIRATRPRTGPGPAGTR